MNKQQLEIVRLQDQMEVLNDKYNFNRQELQELRTLTKEVADASKQSAQDIHSLKAALLSMNHEINTKLLYMSLALIVISICTVFDVHIPTLLGTFLKLVG